MSQYTGTCFVLQPISTKRCPLPTVAFLWHEYRVRGFHPTIDDRPVTLKKLGAASGLRLGGGGFSGGSDGAGAHDAGPGRHGDDEDW